MAVAQETIDHLRPAGLADVDPEIATLLEREAERQRGQIELIASENFTWPSILEAVGSTPTNKYAEGYPGKRYYGGCEVVDEIEQTAIDRAKALFGAEHANVQAHAGAQANMAAYAAVLQPGDTILSLSLDHGGHLTHGLKVNFSGRLYTIVHYGVDRAIFPGAQGGPLLHTIAAKATCFRIAQTEPFRDYQRQVRANADALAETLLEGGLDVLTGGTDTHLLLVDLRDSQWSGKDAQERLESIRVKTNRNTSPFDERPPMIASGLRLGTPAGTMRGFDEDDFREVGRIIVDALDPDADLESLIPRVDALCARRPLYPGFRGFTSYLA